ncbi:MAG: alpha/beta hydrolase [Anaerolineae bacterium]|nr:alpha/beta hydrolase [Anaerolineae bacterium]NUQ06479.1 alpha/beta hydrolase [Anaerolineae bacterium]
MTTAIANAAAHIPVHNAAPWKPYPARQVWHTPHIAGRLLTRVDVTSPQLDNLRDIHILLPPSYDSQPDRRYPVVYMQDGQNLFDERVSFGGHDWRVDETMQALAAEGIEALIVGVEHGGERRVAEYNPYAHFWNGRGADYLRFLTETLKPMVDGAFRTLPDPAHTGIFGSSMGGLISLYAFFTHPQVFGMAGAMSPSLWIGGGAIYGTVTEAPVNPGRVYLDNGTRESSARRMNALLLAKGYRRDADLKYVVEHDGEHTEAAWARRLPDALRFLLKRR